MTTQSLQVSCHWINDKNQYLSASVEKVSVQDIVKASQLARNAMDWAKQELESLGSEVFRVLEKKATAKTGKRKRSESIQPGRGHKRI